MSGLMVVAWWLWRGGCGVMVVAWWLWRGGCGVMVVAWWLWRGGCGVVVVTWWLWRGGHICSPRNEVQFTIKIISQLTMIITLIDVIIK